MKIVTQEWTHTCGDGCCYTWGTDLWIDDVKDAGVFSSKEEVFRYVLTHKLGHDVDETYEDEE